MEEHHVFPRNAGGTDGPLVRLCTQHHTAAHLVAKRMQSRKDPSELVANEPAVVRQKINYLANAIVKAEALAANDPNKVVTHTMKLGREEQAALKLLKQKYPKRSRSEIIRAAILHLARAK